MKNYYLRFRSVFVVFVVLLCSFQNAGLAQTYPTQTQVQQPINNYVKGYYEWLPADYNTNTTKKYPVIIFIHGIGECGNGTTQLSRVLANGPPKLINQQKFPTSFTVNGQVFSFIVISPQFSQQIRDANVFNDIINTVKTKYRVDTDRIYLTGLSMGGGLSWYYACNQQTYSQGLAAMAIVCGNINSSKPGVQNIALANLPIKIFHNDGDPTVPLTWSQNWFNSLSAFVPAMNPKPRLTVWSSTSHDAWSKAYDPNYKEDNLNVFEWMLTHTRSTTAPPINVPPVVLAGLDQSITLPVSQATLNGTIVDADGTIASRTWSQVAGPSTSTITTPNANQTTVTGLVEGTYRFELSATDNRGATSKDEVVVTVNATPPLINIPPVVIAGLDQIITLPTDQVTLNGTIIDADGSISSRVWTKTAGPAGDNITSPNSNQTTVTNLVAGTYKFQLSATDNHGATTRSELTVTVLPSPIAITPKANAGPDQTIVRGDASSAILDGSASTGLGLIYSWRLLTAVPAEWISNLKNANKAKADAIILPYQDGGYKYELTVSNLLGTSKDTTTVFVNWGKMPPRNSDGRGWHVATAADVAKIPTARVGDLIVDGANNGTISGGNVEINLSSTNLISLKAGQKILIRGGRYRIIRMNFTPGTVRGTKANPVIITNYDGQVETCAMTISNAVGAKLTGKFVSGVSGDVNFPGHDKDNYAFSRGKYGFYVNAAWGSLSSSGIRVMGTDTDSLELEYMEIANGHFTGMMIKEDGGSKDYNDFYIHDLYIHDIHGEGVYIGSTGGDPQHLLNKLKFENVRIINAGNEIFQFGQVGYGSSVNNNVFVNSANNRRSTFANYQDNGAQLGYRSGYQQFRNNILLGTGNAAFNSFIGSKTGRPTANDSIYICNNLVKYGSGALGGYFASSNALPTTVVKIDSNYFGGFSFTADQIYSDSRGVNTTTLLKIANSLPVLFRNNKSDGTKSVLTTGGSILSNNAVSTIANPNFVNSGWPSSFDYSKLGEWGDFVFNTWKDEFANSTGVRFNTPITFQAGEYVTFLSKTYRSKISNNHGHVPQGKTDDYWELITWTSGGNTYTFPPDDYRLVDGDEYKARNIGLIADVVVQPIPNKPPVANAGLDRTITLPKDTLKLAGSGTDSDGTIVVYAWSKIAGPATGKITNENTAAAVLSELVEGVYKYELIVADDKGATGKDTVVVTVNPAPNQAPVADAGEDIYITLPVNNTKLDGSGIDVDGTIAAYQWTKVSGPAAYNLSNATLSNPDVTGLEEGEYIFELTVTDDKAATAKDSVRIVVMAPAVPNVAPTANAGNAITIQLPTNSVTLNGSGTDTDGTIATYQWTKIAGPATGKIVDATIAAAVLSELVEGVYKYELEVGDDKGATGKDTVVVTVNPAPNQAPVADAGEDIYITLPVNITKLDGSGIDVDGTIASYQWTKVSGPAAYNLSNATISNPDVTGLEEGEYVFELTVTDDKAATAKDSVKIVVTKAPVVPNIAPTANAGNAITIELPTNSVTLNGSGTDTDGTIASYLWKKISGPAGFAIANINSASTQVSGLIKGVYVFELTVKDDDGASGKATVQVTVNAAPNEAPTANAGTDITISLPATAATLNGSGNDADGTIASYAWKKISGPSAFTIASPNAAGTAVTGLVEGVYEFELTVTDNKGATAKDNVKIVVIKAPVVPNKAPTANAGNAITIQLPTNSVTLNGSGTDTDGTIASYVWKKISGPSAFTIAKITSASTQVSGLMEGVYVFELMVKDDDGASGKATVQVTVNAAPNVAPTASAGTDITISLPDNAAALSGSGNDVDGTIASYAWKKISGPSAFTIASPNAVGTAVTGLVEGVYEFELTVTDNKGATAKDVVKVTVGKASNRTPIANAGRDTTIAYPANSIVLNGSASYDSDGYIANYKWTKISGPNLFVILNENTSSPTLSSLAAGTYVMELTVTDDKGATATDRIVIVVDGKVPDNKVPKANAGVDQQVSLPNNTARLDGSASSDEDGYIASYQWKQVSGPSTALITNPAAETTGISNLVEGEYVFELIVKDNKGTTSTDRVTIKVTAPGSSSNDKLTLYPVPAKTDLTFKYEGKVDNKPVVVAIVDLRGAVVLVKKVAGSQYSVQGTVDVRLLRNGIYVLKLMTEDGSVSVVKRFNVIH